jgi:hypothetical protein
MLFIFYLGYGKQVSTTIKILVMHLHEVQTQALQLSPSDRWELIDTLLRSLRPSSPPKPKGLAASLIGIAKTSAPDPTDAEVLAMLDERLVQKYL